MIPSFSSPNCFFVPFCIGHTPSVCAPSPRVKAETEALGPRMISFSNSPKCSSPLPSSHPSFCRTRVRLLSGPLFGFGLPQNSMQFSRDLRQQLALHCCYRVVLEPRSFRIRCRAAPESGSVLTPSTTERSRRVMNILHICLSP